MSIYILLFIFGVDVLLLLYLFPLTNLVTHIHCHLYQKNVNQINHDLIILLKSIRSCHNCYIMSDYMI